MPHIVRGAETAPVIEPLHEGTLVFVSSACGHAARPVTSGTPERLRYNAMMQELIRQMLVELGEDPDRQGLRATPLRVEKSLRFLTSGYRADVDQVLNNALFSVDYSEMVIVRDIDFYSLCEHHLLPFFGKCHVAYLPQGRVIGLSKIPRLVDVFARRLQVQERLTNQIAQIILEKINPLGVAVVMEGTHLCMSMRGVEKQNSFAMTSAMLGVFRDNARTRMEFLELIKHRSSISAPASALINGLACVAEDA
jgi:GTP cyclohydrolase I